MNCFKQILQLADLLPFSAMDADRIILQANPNYRNAQPFTQDAQKRWVNIGFRVIAVEDDEVGFVRLEALNRGFNVRIWIQNLDLIFQ
jgi:hypothetical protein